MKARRSKILVVGGAGYVGCVLVEELLRRGYAVKVFDRLLFGGHGLSEFRDQIDLVIGDQRVMDAALLDDVGAVVNLGGLSNDPSAEFNPKANYEMNTVATEQLAKACKAAGISRFLFASTCSIYDRGVEDPDADLILDEAAEVNPRAAYSSSKYEAEQRLLALVDEKFCPVILRKGTIYGWSPRMRFDLVVNTFIKDALTRGQITIHNGGEMWRPMIDVRDAARAYIACLEADDEKVRGQIFNTIFRNMRISELALRVREALAANGINVTVVADYAYSGVRNYRVTARKIETVLGFRPLVTIEESVGKCLERLKGIVPAELEHPRFYNIRWLKVLQEAEQVLGVSGGLLDLPTSPAKPIKSLRAV